MTNFPWVVRCSWTMPIGVVSSVTVKKGRGAFGKMPLVAALSLSSMRIALFLKLSQVNGLTKEEIVTWTTKYVRFGSLVVSDGLTCYPESPRLAAIMNRSSPTIQTSMMTAKCSNGSTPFSAM